MYWTSFVRGLIQGGMKTLTVESDVDVEFINNEVLFNYPFYLSQVT